MNDIRRMNKLIASVEKRLLDPKQNPKGAAKWAKLDSQERTRRICEYLTGLKCRVRR